MGPTILVTGGAGFIGAHVCKALAGRGYAPVAFDNLSAGHADAVRWGPLVVGDVRDHDTLTATLREHRPLAVMHFASFIAAGESVDRPLLYWDNNVGGTLGLLRAMEAAEIGRLVFSSSAAVYGTPTVERPDETHPQAPETPYGATKAAGERLIAEVADAHGLTATALRYFNAAGADPEGQLSERHDPETHLIPLALDAAAGICPALRLHGTDYPTPDGTCIRDYVHVSDLADGHILALEADTPPGRLTAYNLGSGSGHSVRRVLDLVETVTGRPVPVIDAARRPGDTPVLVADPSRAREQLGWAPRYTLEDQIAHAWAARAKGAPGARGSG